MLGTIARRIDRLLARRGVMEGGHHGPDRWSEEAPVLAGIADASVQGRGRVRAARGSARAALRGLPRDHGAVHVGARIMSRVIPGSSSMPRSSWPDGIGRGWSGCAATRSGRPWRRIASHHGQVLLELRHRWADGTSHLLFDPVELLERLAALTPRPRINLVLYYGVLGARSAWRSRLGEPELAARGRTGAEPAAGTDAARPAPRAQSNLLWAQLMQRSFGFDVLACPRCGGRLRLVAVIEEARVIRRILGHLGLPTEVPAARPSRAAG